MVNQEIKKLQSQVEEALAAKKVKDALAILGKLTKEYHGGTLIDDHYNLEFNYKSLLTYAVEGVVDPEQQKMYDKIIQGAYGLSDKLFALIQTNHSSDYIYTVRREMKDSGFDLLKELEQFYRHNELSSEGKPFDQSCNQCIEKIFQYLFCSENFTSEDKEHFNQLLCDDSVHYAYRSIFVSALTIGALQEFNEQKILLLLDIILCKHNEIRLRALVGAILLLYKYDSRLEKYQSISARLKLLADNSSLVKSISSLVINLIRTRETEKIVTKLNEEILPEVVKMKPNLRNKLDLEDMISEKFMEGENPEWDDFFKDSPELRSKLEELTEWQQEGADVFLSTFKTLKHFSFFNDIRNWLIPFYLENPSLEEAFRNDKHIFGSEVIQESLSNSGFLCNSDKYSLFLSVPFMPDFQKEMMAKMFEQQLEQMDEIEKDEALVKPEKKEANICNRYIQDLYRFYKLYPQKHQFEDVFMWKMEFHKKWFYRSLLTDQSYLRQVGEFFFKKGYYKEASEVFKLLLKESENHVELLQKTGYCLQQEAKFAEALQMYLSADILKPEQIWTVKKIALMYKSLGNTEKALQYYLEAERLKPDNLHTQALIGHCYLDLKNYEEALKYYFKVEYLDQSNTKVWSPIAWCSFVSGNYDQAEKYYQKLIVSSSNFQDYINLGHVYLSKKDRKQALVVYKKAIAKMNNEDQFFKIFNEDRSVLLERGVNALDIPIIIDQLKYSLEE